jgi:hypothetical protein
MKAILINPFNQTITEIKYSGNFKEIYKLIDCSTFDCINIDDDNTLFVDDEGLLKQNRYFYWKDYTNLAGKALIIGVDYQTGEDCDTSWSLQEVENMVEWLPEGHEEEPMMEFITWN